MSEPAGETEQPGSPGLPAPSRATPLGVEGTLAGLDRLRRGIQECATRAAALEQEASAASSRWKQQEERAGRERRERLALARTTLESAVAARRQSLVTRHTQRRARLERARRSAQEARRKEIDATEARAVFQVQRDLLQAGRDRERAKEQADATLAAFQNDWAAEESRLAGVEAGLLRAFRGYARFRRMLAETTWAGGTELPGSARQFLDGSRESRTRLEERLRRFRRSPLPWLFSIVPPWPFALIVAILHVAAFLFGPRMGLGPWPWERVAASAGVCLAALGGLHWLGRRLASASARELAATRAEARALLDLGGQAAVAEQQRDKEQADVMAENRTRALEERWNRMTAAAEEERRTLEERLSQKQSRAHTRNDRLEKRELEELERSHAAERKRIEDQSEADGNRFLRQLDEQRAGLSSRQQLEWSELATTWKSLTHEICGLFESSRATASRLFPDWADASWDSWSPPSEFVAAALFGHLEVDLAAFSGGLPADPRLALPDPSRLKLPLVLVCPDEGAILFETEQAGRDEALSSLNNLVLRFLSGAPPGRVIFTILDPVGLGQGFAGLMHLTDHEDRVINRRIWTQPEQIEQRLADLNDQIEKVTQLYLRNEHRSIAEYNEKAGRIAEPYHFLVVADLPGSFSEIALARLVRIVTNGPRCGVFPLIHWDRRRPVATDFPAEELRRACTRLVVREGRFQLADPRAGNASLTLEPPPPPRRTTGFLRKIGQVSADANRVEMPFTRIAPEPGAVWSLDTAQEVRVPIGLSGATKLQQLALGRGTRQHVLIAGKTGSGKSTLFHVLITNLALWCSPDQVEFYLVDFKKGVEFRCYAAHRLPHARVIAIESDREFALSVLQRVDEELHRRGDLFRRVGAQDLAAYRRTPGAEILPRTLLIVDEFQEFFTDDDRVAHNAALLLDRLVRQGRAFGIHVLLGSQTLGGAYTLARTTLGQMAVRIALQCNQADALLIMDDDNSAPRLLSRPGEAIYNDAAGATDGNSPFQVVWLSEEEREGWLGQIHRRAAQGGLPPPVQVVFEGNSPADVRENESLAGVLAAVPRQPPASARAWLGAPNAIKGPTEIAFQRQSGNHLLCVSQADESALAMLGLSFAALAAQHPRGTAQFALLDASPEGSPHRRFLEHLAAVLPHDVALVGNAGLGEFMTKLADELGARSDPTRAATAPPWFVGVHHLERFKALRYEDDFRMTLDDSAAAKDPGQILNRVLSEGASVGLHILCVCDTYGNATRFLSRKALGEFEIRVLSQMSANDSASLIDSPKAASLGLHRALLYKAREGSIEVFRPYALPAPEWLEESFVPRPGRDDGD